MKLIIDRFEGEFAVVETPEGALVTLPISLLPENTAEGDVIFICKDESATAARKERIKKLMDDLFE